MTSPADTWTDQWLAARRWRRRIESELARLRLTLAQWLVLDRVATLIRETNDAVSQIQVARRLELDKVSMSRLMAQLDRRGLIDRAPAFGGPEYRIYLSRKGKHWAAQGRAIVDAVSARMSEAGAPEEEALLRQPVRR